MSSPRCRTVRVDRMWLLTVLMLLRLLRVTVAVEVRLYWWLVGSENSLLLLLLMGRWWVRGCLGRDGLSLVATGSCRVG